MLPSRKPVLRAPVLRRQSVYRIIGEAKNEAKAEAMAEAKAGGQGRGGQGQGRGKMEQHGSLRGQPRAGAVVGQMRHSGVAAAPL